MAKNLTLKQIVKHGKAIKQCSKIKDIALLLNTKQNNISLLAFEPLYYHFKLPKKNNGFRLIEAPEYKLKRFQRKLNTYLQAVYYLSQTKPAYGYIIKPAGVTNPKNIYSNALRHLNNGFMLNMDFKDFFHQITQQKIMQLFKSNMFEFDTHTAHTLSKICCFKKRLPMGAPTSPALSNLYTIALDKQLENWATKNNITYTRFVDDLTFSSNTTPFTAMHQNQIQNIASQHQLFFNPGKIKFFGKNNTKKVTGLVLNQTVDIDPDYYTQLNQDLQRLKHAIEVQFLSQDPNKKDYLKTYKQEIMGKIAFISAIEGKQSKQYIEFLNKYLEALEPPREELIKRWTKFSNYT